MRTRRCIREGGPTVRARTTAFSAIYTTNQPTKGGARASSPLENLYWERLLRSTRSLRSMYTSEIIAWTASPSVYMAWSVSAASWIISRRERATYHVLHDRERLPPHLAEDPDHAQAEPAHLVLHGDGEDAVWPLVREAMRCQLWDGERDISAVPTFPRTHTRLG